MPQSCCRLRKLLRGESAGKLQGDRKASLKVIISKLAHNLWKCWTAAIFMNLFRIGAVQTVESYLKASEG